MLHANFRDRESLNIWEGPLHLRPLHSLPLRVNSPYLDPNNRTIRLQVGNAPALAQKLYVVVVEHNS